MAGKKNGRPLKYTVEQVLEAIKDTGGIKTEVCQRLNCGRRTIYVYIDRFPEIKEAFEEEEEKVLDMAESSLFAMIQNGDLTAIFYYLNNKGRRRGYGAPSGKIREQEQQVEERKTGVLVTPGILSEESWEKQAAKK